MRPIIQVWLKSDPVIFSQSCIFSHGCKQPEVKKKQNKENFKCYWRLVIFLCNRRFHFSKDIFVILSPLILSYIKTTIVCVKMKVSLINIALI